MDQPLLSKATSPRQTRAVETIARLLEAVEVLVGEEGPEAVTTTRIAVTTGLAVGTIYRYFADRDALLLAAYDATVARIVRICEAELAGSDPAMPIDAAARRMLGLYLDAAEAIPAHAGLLKAMRAIRPVASDQSGNNEVTIIGDLIAPFLGKFAAQPDPGKMHFLSVLLGTLVDLYLVTPDPAEKQRLRTEIEAHMLLALKRTLAPTG